MLSTSKQGKPRKKIGKGSRNCHRCGTHRAVLRSYSLMICRRCFREIAKDIGFRKF
ncbi:MAG: 30S ribosomal protein S14 [Candidatus Hodarchaeales archaeon]